MVKIKINGKELEGRVFQNMPQALAFSFQNGSCHTAKSLEIFTVSEDAGTKTDNPKDTKLKDDVNNKEPKSITGTVAITGNLTEGETLTADISALVGLKDTDLISYQWYGCKGEGETVEISKIDKAQDKTYALRAEDIGNKIYISVNVSGYEKEAVSNVYGPVAAIVNDDKPKETSIVGTPPENMTFEELKYYAVQEGIPHDNLSGTEEEMKVQLLAIVKAVLETNPETQKTE